MVVDINVFYTFNMGDNIKVNCIDGWRHCAWQGQLDGGDHGGRWHHDVSHKLESLVINRPLLATFLLHLYDVMNLGIIKHIEAVKHWNALTISTAHHIPVFIEEHSNWSDTSWCHQPLWSSPSNYPCHPQCRQPSTHMFIVQVVTLAESKKIDVNHHHRSISDPSWRKFQPKWYIWMSVASLVFSFKLSLPSMVSLSINSCVLSVIKHVESVNNFHINHQNH